MKAAILRSCAGMVHLKIRDGRRVPHLPGPWALHDSVAGVGQAPFLVTPLGFSATARPAVRHGGLRAGVSRQSFE